MGAFDMQGDLPPNFYFDPHFQRDAVKILPGEFYATGAPLLLVTVLGSCVSACIRDRQSGVGGMNHFMLPEEGSSDGGLVAPSARYGTHAMEMLLNRLAQLGARRANLEAKVFGGGAVMKEITQAQVGERNASFVLSFLEREGIPVVAQDLLEDCPRKIYFFLESGRVKVKKLRSLHNDTIRRREMEYKARLRNESLGGDVELF